MCSKICSLIFLLGSVQIISGQHDLLRCDYGGAYYCNLTISNSGEAFFTDIEGLHVEEKENSDVFEITSTSLSNSATIPSVICAKFPNLAKLSYISIGLDNIERFAFKSCKFVKQIYLTDNEISTIDELAFSKNVELQKLYLAQNRIATLPNNIFETLVNLKQLDISYNHIETLANEWFENLGNLQFLYLNNNKIQELPSGVFTALTSLGNLNLGKNQLEILNSESFGKLPKLTLVDVTDNKINAIDEMFIENTGLANFAMDGNVCANDALIDSSPLRESMKQELGTCFENFNNIVVTTTELSTTEDSTSDSTRTDDSSTEPSTTDESNTDTSTTDDSTTDESITEDSITENSTSDEVKAETTPDSASGIMIGKIILIAGTSIRILFD